ncbi:non-ribosomal peptide synthetase [Crocosphaera sp. XPORK-15E]|uniref:non-ribosomal peptide synthetase n=1 Tax=Crocosphaera sp. XPORK-15E TaxID=3110247 RepID=UPI002B202D50|nr:non-ribosomal peptide synthetase [Crocosphaera sp. XPORK-15E]MEA5536734.1 amino acid adenylation domain-containing protein [Crocosphaera sp. XPORK-15E]
MKVVEFLSYLNSLDIKLWLENEKLKYQAPPGVMTPKIKQKIGARKSEILVFLKQVKISDKNAYSPIIPVSRDDDLPLSFAQQRMWFLYQMDSQNPAYNEIPVMRLTGSLNINILEQSINELVQRHEILRTSFSVVEGKPIQIISPTLNINLNVINLKDSFIKNKDEIITQEIQKPFDLTQVPLLRCTLIEEGYQSYILIIVIHHIIIDGWSRTILFKELFDIYQAFILSLPSPLPKLPIQYADFAVWQRQWLQGEILDKQLNYWKKQLANSPHLLELPSDKSRSATPTFQGHSIAFKIDTELTEKLKCLSQKSGVTLFITLLATLNILLFRYSDQKDILIGTPVANRNRQEIEPLIGFFVNTLVMRNSLDEKLSFQELLQQVRTVVLEGYAHQDVPFEQVVDALQIERSLSYNPLFQVMFALQNTPMTKLEQSGLKVTPIPVENVRVKFDLSLILEERETDEGNYLEGVWEYNSDLFLTDRIIRMGSHFQTLLTEIINNSQQAIGKLPLLTESEKQQLLVEWNQTKILYPNNKCIHQLFEEQAENKPDAVAVFHHNESFTYQELNQKANQLAHYLKSLGVTSNKLVGICLERSPLMIVGFLGILKAGGAYVPLDANYPPERLDYMLEDSGVSVLLTQTKLEKIFTNYKKEKVCLDKNWDTIEKKPVNNPRNKINYKNLVYVIYTSGSTGTPKGVLIQHQNLLNLVNWHQNAFNITEKDRGTQLAGIAFDASVWEIWPYLTCGACIYIVPQDIITSPNLLKDFLCHHRITVSFLPTPLAEVIITDDWSADCSLRFMLTGGDKLNHFPPTSLPFTLVNNYGPTENTVVTTSQKLTSDVLSQKDPSIGRPIANNQVYILDKCQQPVPIGIIGELYIGGAGLAYGYLNRKDLTETRFIPNPFSQIQGERLYKTGDLVRYRNDGKIEFVGRIDDQVKIRGFRIELGEIEAVLNIHSQIKEAIVIAKEEQPGLKRLYAYVIGSDQLNIAQLRSFLEEKLPQYMLPAFFVQLDAFPLTTNGKIDRRALPKPDINVDEQVTKIIPSTDTEKILVDIWKQILGLEQIGISDNFFELGGDSILAIQIVAKANQAGLQIIPKQLFSHQTIGQLASITQITPVSKIIQGLVTGKVPLTPIQKWFFEQQLSEPHHFNQSIFLEVPGNLKPDLLKKTVLELLEHHDALRLRFFKETEQWQQYNSDDCTSFAFDVVNLSPLSNQEQLNKMGELAEDYQRSLNLEKGPLISVILFQLGETAKLLIIIHHLAIDGVSWRILTEDLATSYQQLESEKLIELLPKTTSFKDWSEELQKYAQKAEHKSQLAYWLNADVSEIYPLPLDYKTDNSYNIVANAKIVSFNLREEQTRLLLQEVSQAYNTQINDVLLTALVQTLVPWTGDYNLLLDLEGHGRENIFDDLILSRTIGWFTSLFPVYLKGENMHSLGDCLKSVKEQLRRIPNRGFDYGIGYYLNSDSMIQSRLKDYPKPEISFNYLGQFTHHQIGSIGWKFAQEFSGSIHSPLGQRSHLIDINALVIDGKLQMEWQYSEKFHKKNTMENLINVYQQSLKDIMNHCLSTEGDYTPSDFPNANLSQEELDDLLLELD